ncbi:MAG: hypothetical protein ACXWL5_04655 [Candidatus Chromulinivorax sp.]
MKKIFYLLMLCNLAIFCGDEKKAFTLNEAIKRNQTLDDKFQEYKIFPDTNDNTSCYDLLQIFKKVAQGELDNKVWPLNDRVLNCIHAALSADHDIQVLSKHLNTQPNNDYTPFIDSSKVKIETNTHEAICTRKEFSQVS